MELLGVGLRILTLLVQGQWSCTGVELTESSVNGWCVHWAIYRWFQRINKAQSIILLSKIHMDVLKSAMWWVWKKKTLFWKYICLQWFFLWSIIKPLSKLTPECQHALCCIWNEDAKTRAEAGHTPTYKEDTRTFSWQMLKHVYINWFPQKRNVYINWKACSLIILTFLCNLRVCKDCISQVASKCRSLCTLYNVCKTFFV